MPQQPRSIPAEVIDQLRQVLSDPARRQQLEQEMFHEFQPPVRLDELPIKPDELEDKWAKLGMAKDTKGALVATDKQQGTARVYAEDLKALKAALDRKDRTAVREQSEAILEKTAEDGAEERLTSEDYVTIMNSLRTIDLMIERQPA
ncbi:hypothetical protein LMG29542_08179 [Paraburkholderia humisilvae]|uniref:Uncharacterized protein n=2 Tax=Paraburkholderia humisilvae TaxID=627669 RepID=A0A6J5FBG9_9BURK|nr:hypothetical protein LMG29542_08179 [Paraburkholderia humisilvae]